MSPWLRRTHEKDEMNTEFVGKPEEQETVHDI
jgi:hypothetical protein